MTTKWRRRFGWIYVVLNGIVIVAAVAMGRDLSKFVFSAIAFVCGVILLLSTRREL